ncbi:hypothetical protein HPB49_002638 [Dermacentor silvarum]|uniref:Uncharacterized protein n=1 Tax=Dermacentor silvarum TaxID=543639 RepID=A0ACB8CUJ3_DERSI|nr:hypothetical protein HPB49_002638 [Dermacentor silvarum]
MATPAAAGAATPTAANATADAPEPSYAEATSSLERLKPQAALSDLDREEMECQDTDEGDNIIPHDTDTPATRIEQDEDKEEDWQMVLTIRQKKALARAGRKTVGAGSGYDSSSQHLGPPKKPPLKKKKTYKRHRHGKSDLDQESDEEDKIRTLTLQTTPLPNANPLIQGPGPGKPAAPPQGKSASPKLKKHPPLPRLPATDFKIVFRPRGGLDLRPINGGALLPILCAGAEIDYNQARSQDKLRIDPHNNSLTVSTPSKPRMKRYVQLQGLQLNDQQYPMKAYVAAPDNAIKGILYNAVYNQSQEEIFEDLVVLNPSSTFTIADARQLGRTKSILVTFINTTEVPRQLNFYGAVYSCHPFKAKVEACFNCRKPGHRADVCPKERTGLCPRCGIAHPIKPTLKPTINPIFAGLHTQVHTLRWSALHGDQALQGPLRPLRQLKQQHCQIHHPDNTTSESTPCVSTQEFQKLKKSPPIPFKVQKPFENKLPTRPPSKPFGVVPATHRAKRPEHRETGELASATFFARERKRGAQSTVNSPKPRNFRTKTAITGPFKARSLPGNVAASGAAPGTSRRSWILIRLTLARHVTHTQSSYQKEIQY